MKVQKFKVAQTTTELIGFGDYATEDFLDLRTKCISKDPWGLIPYTDSNKTFWPSELRRLPDHLIDLYVLS